MFTTRRVLAFALLVLSALSIAREDVAAQQQVTRASAVLVPIAGTADAAGLFSGTLLIQRFEAQGNAVVAVGTVNGALSDTTGVTRNVVTQVTLPLDINASLARRNTDPAIAQASCEAMHLEFGTSTLSVLGSTIGLDPVTVDIVAAAQPTIVAATQPTTVANNSNTQSVDPAAGLAGRIDTPTAAAQPRASGSQLGSLLCSVDLRSTAASRPQLVRLLNQILSTLG